MRRLPQLFILSLLFTAFALITTACGEANLDELLGDAAPTTSNNVTATTDGRDSGADDPVDQPEPDNTVETPTVDGDLPDAPAGERAGQGDPLPPGAIADLGGGWRVQVLGVTDDATQQILGENEFNDPPPDGSRFTLVRVAIGYYGSDEPAMWWDVSLSALANGVELSSDCGVIPDDTPFSEAYAGAVWEGNTCFVTSGPLSDVQLFAEQFFSFDAERVFMTPGDAGGATSLPHLDGPQPGASSTPGRTNPIPAGTPTAVSDEWEITMTNGRIGTDEVMALNQFNDGPPPGHDFYLVDITAEYVGEESGTIFDLTITGVADSNRGLETWCGIHPNDFEFGLEAFPGGTLQGTRCVVVPTDEADSLVFDVSASFEFDAEHVYFAPR